MAREEQTTTSAGRANDEAAMVRVLLAAGQRPRPPEDVTRAVRAAVREEWRRTVEVRARQRRWTALAAAAAVAALALALWTTGPLRSAPAPVVASVVRSSGSVDVDAGLWSRMRAVRERQELRAGEELTTGRDGQAAVELADGTSVRLDRDTRIALAAPGRFVLSRGGLYVDSGRTGERHSLEIETPLLSVRHLGTRYEVRVLPEQVRVSVREGRVRVQPREGRALEGDAGERLLVSSSGKVERSSVAPYDPQWSWAATTAPPFEIDGRPLPAFLQWAGHELGRPVVFASPQARATAEGIVLSGSASGLSVTEALAAVLSTTPLRSRERQGVLVIEAAAAR